RPPVLPPHVAAVARPALRVVILGGIIYMREYIGNWAMLNENCQKFKAIFKRLESNGKSGKSLVYLFKRAKLQFHEESTTETKKFNQEHVWLILKEHLKWDSPDPVMM
ncbi:hypothetical protein Tco_0646595, partial [Tanacetum coccineum]